MKPFRAYSPRQIGMLWLVGLAVSTTVTFIGPRVVLPLMKTSFSQSARYQAMQIQREHELDSAYLVYAAQHADDSVVQQLIKERRERALAPGTGARFSEAQLNRVLALGVVDTSFQTARMDRGFFGSALASIGLALLFSAGRAIPWLLGALTVWWAINQPRLPVSDQPPS